jgi:hypothetical protein
MLPAPPTNLARLTWPGDAPGGWKLAGVRPGRGWSVARDAVGLRWGLVLVPRQVTRGLRGACLATFARGGRRHSVPGACS